VRPDAAEFGTIPGDLPVDKTLSRTSAPPPLMGERIGLEGRPQRSTRYRVEIIKHFLLEH